jgi:hypothetical protein
MLPSLSGVDFLITGTVAINIRKKAEALMRNKLLDFILSNYILCRIAGELVSSLFVRITNPGY